MDINNIILVGNATRDLELIYAKSGTAVGKIGIAVNTGFGDKKEVNYFNVTIWGKTAEAMSKYLSKGKKFGVIGELRQNRYQDKNGNNRSDVYVNCKHIQLLGGNKGESAPQADDGFTNVDFTGFEPNVGTDENIPF